MLQSALAKGQELCDTLRNALLSHEARRSKKRVGLQTVPNEEFLKRADWKTDTQLREDSREAAQALRIYTYKDTIKSARGENCAFIMGMFENSGLLEKLPIDKERLEEFISRASLCYRDVPYHNWAHATDVTQTVYSLIYGANGARYLTALQQLALLVAAVGHDMDHNGVNNSLHKQVQSALAMRYNDKSILENHHSASAFALMKVHEANFLKNFSREQFFEFRELVIGCILGTDMARHGEYMTRLKTLKEQKTAGKEGTDVSPDDLSEEDKILLMEIILKVSDISNVVKPFDLSVEWARRVITEFFTQGDEEKRRNLSVSKMFDRETEDPVQGQFGFIDFLAGPIFEGLYAFLPEMAPLMDRIKATKEGWQKVKEESESSSETLFGPYDPFKVEFHTEY